MASSNLDPQSTLTEELNLITTRAQTFTGANGAAIALGESDVTEIVCRASSGTIAPPVGAHLRVEGSFTGICLQTGQALRCDDTESDNRVDPAVSRAVGIRSMVVVPIKEKETILGVLGVFSAKANAFSDLHFAVLKTMASEITAAIQKAKRVAEGGTAPTPALGTPAPKFAGPMTGKFTIPIQKPAAAPASASTAVKTPPPIPTPMPTPVPTPVKTAPPPPPPPPPKLVPVTTPVKTAPPPPPPPPPLPPKEHVTASAAAAAPAPAKRDSGGYMIPPIKPSDRPKEQEISFGTLDRVGEKGKKPFPIMPVGIAVGVVVVVVVGYFVFSGGSKSTPEPAATTTASKPAPSTPAPSSTTATGTSTSPTTTTSNPPAATTTAPTTTASATPAPTKTTTPPPPPTPAPTKTQTAAKATPVKTGPAPVTRGTGQTSSNSNENVAAPTISLAPTNTPTIPMGNVNVPTAALRTSQVAPAQLLSRVDPQYPSVARQFHAEGTVVVNATVGPDGRVKTATAISGNPLLRDSAVTAVRQWRYKPAMLNGQAVESTVQVTLKFSAQ